MFAPLGYSPLDPVVAVCQEAADEYMSTAVQFEDPASNAGREAHFGAALLATWLLAWTLNRVDVAICSPDGRIFRTGQLFVLHEDGLALMPWDWPLAEGSRLQSLLQRAIAEGDFSAGIERFRFIDVVTGTIHADQDKLSRLRRAAVEMDEVVERQCQIAQHFDGWAVCVPEAQAYKVTADLWTALGAHPTEHHVLPGRRASVGRPGLQGLAGAAYFRVFPNGHQGMSWKDVERLVEQEAGRRISAKTIQRAIGENLDKMD